MAIRELEGPSGARQEDLDDGIIPAAGPAPIALPSTLANLAIWNRFNTGLFQDTARTTPATGTDPVGAWADQSGANNHMSQATGGDKPVLNANAVDFVSSDFLTATNALTLKPMTFFCLIKFDDLTGGRRILDGGGNSVSIDLDSTTLRLLKSDTAVIGLCSTAMSTGAFTRIIVTYDASGNYAFYVNGVAAGTGTTNLAIPSATYILGGRAALFLDAQIKDWGVYTDIKAAGDRASLDAYMASL